MRNLWILCLLLGAVAWGQVKPAKSPSPAAPASADADDDDEAEKPQSIPASKVAPSAAVLTIQGLCSKAPAKTQAGSAKHECRTVVTRAQFEKLLRDIQVAGSPQIKRQLASSYPKLLVMAHEAEARGLDKGERFEEKLRFARLQILSQELVREFQEEASKVSEKDIADYYRANSAAFEQASLERIFVPLRKRVDLPQEKAGEQTAGQMQMEAEEAMKKEAEIVRTRAAAGGDFADLQKAAYDAAGMKSDIPAPKLGKRLRTSVPPGHVSVFDLKPGDISSVFSDGSGYYIYKLDAKETQPLDEVEDQIRATLQNQRLRKKIESVDQSFSTEVNPSYFGGAREPGAPGPSSD
jgi:parvulin-like peptidyl-prolyl isomerase